MSAVMLLVQLASHLQHGQHYQSNSNITDRNTFFKGRGLPLPFFFTNSLPICIVARVSKSQES